MLFRSDFIVEGTLNACTLIVLNNYYNTDSGSELVIAQDAVLNGLTQNGNGRFDIQGGNMTVYGYVNGQWNAGGGSAWIGMYGIASTLTIDGTYAAADNNNGKFINNGNQTLSIGDAAEIFVQNGAEFAWNTVTNEGSFNVADSTLTVANLTNKASVNVSGESTIQLGKVTGNGWINMDTVKLDSDTNIQGGKIRFVNGESTLDGATLNGAAFQVGFGAYLAKDERENVADIVVNVTNNSYIHAKDEAYYGWVGTGWFESDADKAAAMTDARYTLNIVDSLAEFGYMHVSNDGILNVTGKTADQNHNGSTDYSFYAGSLIVNGIATFDGADALVLNTNISCDNKTDNAGKLVIKNGTSYVVDHDDGGANGGTFKINNKGVVDVLSNATLDIKGSVQISKDAALNVNGADFVQTNGVIDNKGTVSIDNYSKFETAEIANCGDVIVKDSQFTAGKVVLNGYYTVSGFAAGAARDITLVFFAAGEHNDGIQLTVRLNAGETSVKFYNDALVDGLYDITAVDGSKAFQIHGFEIDKGDFDVYGISKLDIAKVSGGEIVVHEATLYDSNVAEGVVSIQGNTKFVGTSYIDQMDIYADVTVGDDVTLSNGSAYVNAGTMDIAGTFNTDAVELANNTQMNVSGAVNAGEFNLGSASAAVVTGVLTAGTGNIDGTADVAGIMNVDEANVYGTLNVNGGSLNGGDVTVAEAGELAVADGSIELDGKLTADGSVTVTGDSVVEINELDGAILIDNAAVTGGINKGGVLNVIGESSIGEGFNADYFAFGSLEETVDADINLNGLATAGFAALNGTVDISGQMDRNGFGLAQLKVSGIYNTAAGDITEGDRSAGSTTVNIGSATDTDAYVKAHQVYIAENDALNEHTLNVYGELEADRSIFNKAMGNLNVYGKVSAAQLQAAGNVTVSGENASLIIDGNNPAYGIKIGTDEVGLRSQFVVEDGAFVDSNLLLEVGYNSNNSDRNGDLIVNGATLVAANIKVQSGSTFTVMGESTIKAAVIGDIAFEGDVVLTADTQISIDGNVTADGDLTMKYNAITGAASFTVDGNLSITDVTLPTIGAITLVDGAASFGSLSINGMNVVDNFLAIVDGDQVNLYEVNYDAADVKLSVSNPYQRMSGNITAVAQGSDSYTFTVDAAITGGLGAYSYVVNAYNANGELIATADGLTITLTDDKSLTSEISFTVTATDRLGNDFAYTTDAFNTSIADCTGPVFVGDDIKVSASVVNGKLQLTWEAYDAFGLDEYIITINGKETVFGTAYEKMSFAQVAVNGENTYSIIAVDNNGNRTEVTGSYTFNAPAANLVQNGTSQIVTYYAAEGIVGYYTVNGDTTTWAPVWNWGNSDVWEVVAVGNFGSSSVNHDGLLLYNKTNKTFAAWHNLNDPSYEYESLCWADGDFAVNALVDLDGNGKDDVLIYSPDGNQKGSFGVVLDGAVYKDIWHIENDKGIGVGVELVNAGSFGAADGLDSLIVKREGAYYFMHNNDRTFNTWDWEFTKIADVEADGEIVAVGDFSNDGIDDIVYRKSSGEVFVWEDGNADDVRFAGNLGDGWEVAGVGDYNGDGIEDLLTREIGAYGNIGYWGGADNANWTNLGTGIKNDKENNDVVTIITASK